MSSTFSFETVPERAAEDRERLEAGGTDPVVVVRDLRTLACGGRPEVDRLVHAPDVGLEYLGAAVSGPAQKTARIAFPLVSVLMFTLFTSTRPPCEAFATPRDEGTLAHTLINGWQG
jgi:hypothetical protein